MVMNTDEQIEYLLSLGHPESDSYQAPSLDTSRVPTLTRTRRTLTPLAGAAALLAAVIVLDQFPRNLFRGSPRAFATDALALRISHLAIEAQIDSQLTQQQRVFLYMPFQHCEDRALQRRSIELFSSLDDANTLSYAHKHKEVIDRFGRYPHRNAVLGRESTPQELEFLKTHPGF